ncbi:MAG: tripartite tricarboxylate transporter permease [Synergistaceae bacterium]|uniref:tripartite tricarboxylate transporter permease n=1 Tax=Aminivibrio sp. TaxID=1872489 RepID=UPI001D4BB58D|nr:tripartite tricarboxylate transporter permease [Synergistaceae bacterium]NCC56191.1 C4-dicarboxylate ABC transporter permease [Synergistales bacterium]MDD3390460.1 tripartite tricarboxylate transporter permease [Synergistaceae bacterium]MDD3688410.1 tripartite tricarboxylate transporter permease [Synergistaceae bacterium]MDD4020980.1 tripartite tricarboxylate transporter permease [Synergistaceae bacterium]
MTEFFLPALSGLMDPAVLFSVTAGTIVGIIVGAMPGLTATMAVALLIPVTFGMPPLTGLALMGGVYCGGMYGGAISSILLSTPGTPAAAATAFDGYPMTKQGKGGTAITVATWASFWGGIFSTVALLLMAPALAHFSLRFGPPEYFVLAVMGLSSIVTLTKGSMVKGLMSGFLGLVLATIGMDPISGYMRFTFNSIDLFDGIPFMPALIGLFSVSQILDLTAETHIVEDLTDTIATIKRSRLPKGLSSTIAKGSVIGTIVGMLPGAGATIAAFISYNFAKQSSRDSDTFGKGNPKGVAASESANNGCVGGSLIPLLTLGIPGNSVAAALMGGLLIQGLIPGPELFSKYGAMTYGFIISLFIANIIFLVLGLYLAPYFAKVTSTPNALLIPGIAILSVIGSYAINNNMFDVWLMIGFGICGYFLEKGGFSTGALVLGLILGPIAELGFGQALIMSAGSPMIFFERPLCILLWVITILLMLPAFAGNFKKAKNRVE